MVLRQKNGGEQEHSGDNFQNSSMNRNSMSESSMSGSSMSGRGLGFTPHRVGSVEPTDFAMYFIDYNTPEMDYFQL